MGEKKSAEERASGIATEQTEVHALFEKVRPLRNCSEFIVQQAI